MIASVTSALRSHIDSRLSSPFAAAFVASWVVVNFGSILLLSMSALPVEDRVDRFLSAINLHNGFYEPLLGAVVVTLFVYVGSLVFLLISNVYIWARGLIEKRFDELGWMEKRKYVLLKEKYIQEFKKLMELATDNVAILDEANTRAFAAEEELGKARKSMDEKSLELISISAKLELASSQVASQTTRMAEKDKEILKLQVGISNFKDILKSIKPRLDRLQNALMRDASQELRPLMNSADSSREVLISRPVPKSELVSDINDVLLALDRSSP